MAYMKQLAALMMAMGLLTGCGMETNIAGEQERPAAQEQESAVDETNGADKEPREEKQPVTENVESAKGKFIGIVDTTSIEVEMDGEARVFQLSDTVKDVIPQLEEGIIIQFSYSKNDHGQLILEYIQ